VISLQSNILSVRLDEYGRRKITGCVRLGDQRACRKCMIGPALTGRGVRDCCGHSSRAVAKASRLRLCRPADCVQASSQSRSLTPSQVPLLRRCSKSPRRAWRQARLQQIVGRRLHGTHQRCHQPECCLMSRMFDARLIQIHCAGIATSARTPRCTASEQQRDASIKSAGELLRLVCVCSSLSAAPDCLSVHAEL
jgi:hypothetical protein